MQYENLKLYDAKRNAAELSIRENKPVFVVVQDGGLCLLSYENEEGTIHAYVDGESVLPEKAMKLISTVEKPVKPIKEKKPRAPRKKKEAPVGHAGIVPLPADEFKKEAEKIKEVTGIESDFIIVDDITPADLKNAGALPSQQVEAARNKPKFTRAGGQLIVSDYDPAEQSVGVMAPDARGEDPKPTINVSTKKLKGLQASKMTTSTASEIVFPPVGPTITTETIGRLRDADLLVEPMPKEEKRAIEYVHVAIIQDYERSLIGRDSLDDAAEYAIDQATKNGWTRISDFDEARWDEVQIFMANHKLDVQVDYASDGTPVSYTTYKKDKSAPLGSRKNPRNMKPAYDEAVAAHEAKVAKKKAPRKKKESTIPGYRMLSLGAFFDNTDDVSGEKWYLPHLLDARSGNYVDLDKLPADLRDLILSRLKTCDQKEVSVAGYKFPVVEGNPLSQLDHRDLPRKPFKRVPGNPPPQVDMDAQFEDEDKPEPWIGPDTDLGKALEGLLEYAPDLMPSKGEVPLKRTRGRQKGDKRPLSENKAQAVETVVKSRGKGKEQQTITKTEGKASKYKLVLPIIKNNTITGAVRQAIADKSSRGLIQVDGKTYGFSCSNTYSVKRVVYEVSTHGMVMIFAKRKGYLFIPKADFKRVFGDIIESGTYKSKGIYTVWHTPKWVESDYWHKLPYTK